MWVPDNYDAYKRHEAEQTRWIDHLPVCAHCGEHIMGEKLYDIDGTLICMDCMENDYLKPVSDYISEPDDDWDGSEDDLLW